ncbi:hypothetical protein EMIT0P218_40394 [Pseudomonas sp. IT-P218]
MPSSPCARAGSTRSFSAASRCRPSNRRSLKSGRVRRWLSKRSWSRTKSVISMCLSARTRRVFWRSAINRKSRKTCRSWLASEGGATVTPRRLVRQQAGSYKETLRIFRS